MAAPNAIIKLIYEMLSQGNLSRILPLVDEQVTIYIPDLVPFGGVYHGRSGFLALMAKVYPFSDKLRQDSLLYFSPEEVTSDDVFITTGRCTGTQRGMDAPINVPFLHYWLLKDEKVAVFRAFYWDIERLPPYLSGTKLSFTPSPNGQGPLPKDRLPE